MDLQKQLAEVLEAQWIDVLQLILFPSQIRIRLAHLAQLREQFKIEILYQSIQFLPQMANFISQELNFRCPEIDSGVTLAMLGVHHEYLSRKNVICRVLRLWNLP